MQASEAPDGFGPEQASGVPYGSGPAQASGEIDAGSEQAIFAVITATSRAAESGISIEQALRQRSQQVCAALLGEATSPLASGPAQAVAAAAGSSSTGGSELEQAAAAAAGSSRAGGSGPV